MFCANCQRELNETEYPMQLKVCPFCGKPLQHQGSSNVKRGPFGTRRVTSTPVGNPTTSSYSSNATGNIGSYTGHVTAPAQLNHAATPLSAKGIYEPLHAPHSAGPETYHFVFTANANEFFRIWIVNLFLTIITLGVYNAWAKVRTRRYFYANTYLANYNFDYLAKPLPILRGNLIIGAGVLLYAWASRSANSNLLLIILAVFAATFPFLVYQTLRFRAYYTSYRGIRFHFHGKLGESYWVYLLSALPFLGPLASGIFSSTLSNGDIERGTTSAIVLGVLTLLFALIYPYARFLQKRYYFANMAYGTARTTFSGKYGRFYRIYYSLVGRVILFSLVLTLIVVILAVVLPNILASRLVQSAGQAIGFYLVMFLLYLVSIWFTVYLQQYEDAQVTNYSFESSRLGNVHFHSTLKARELTNLVLGNVLAVAFTLGMLYPWARVRYNRYLLEHLTVSTPDDMDQYMADKANDESAIGDSAIDMLDLDIGL